MVKRLNMNMGFLALILSAFSITGFAADSVKEYAKVTVKPQTLMLGEYVVLVLKGDLVEASFEKVDKARIRQNFEIVDIEGDEDRLRLKLYPRRAGELVFPSFYQGSLHFDGLIIVVKENPDVDIKWIKPNLSPFANQLVYWQARVHLSDSANAVTLVEHPHANRQLEHLFKEQPVSESTGITGKNSLLQMGLVSEEPGPFKARSPMVRVKHRGQRPWLFFDDTQMLNVSALPSYLPTNMTVGDVIIQHSSLPFWVEVGALQQLTIALSSSVTRVSGLPGLASQLGGGKNIEWLAPSIKKTQAWQASGAGLLSTKKIEQPFRLLSVGLYTLPEIRVTFFNPVINQLQDKIIPSRWVFAVPAYVLVFLQVLGFAWFVFFVIAMAFVLKQAMIKRKLILALHQCKTAQKVRVEILSWAESAFYRCILADNSLQQSLGCLQGKSGVSSTSEINVLLEKAFFDKEVVTALDFERLSATAIQWANELSIWRLAFGQMTERLKRNKAT